MLRIPLGHEHGPHPGDLSDEDGVEQAADVGQRGGHEDHVVGGEAVDFDHRPGLVGQRPLGVQHPLGRPRRPGGPEHAGHVARLPGRRGGGTLGQVVAGGEEQVRVEPGQETGHLGVPCHVVDRRGHRAQSPAGAVEGDHVRPVRPLPGHDVTSPHPHPVQAARHGRHPCRRPQHVVQRRQVPWPPGPGPLVSLWVHEGRAERHDPALLPLIGRKGSTSRQAGKRGGDTGLTDPPPGRRRPPGHSCTNPTLGDGLLELEEIAVGIRQLLPRDRWDFGLWGLSAWRSPRSVRSKTRPAPDDQ